VSGGGHGKPAGSTEGYYFRHRKARAGFRRVGHQRVGKIQKAANWAYNKKKKEKNAGKFSQGGKGRHYEATRGEPNASRKLSGKKNPRFPLGGRGRRHSKPKKPGKLKLLQTLYEKSIGGILDDRGGAALSRRGGGKGGVRRRITGGVKNFLSFHRTRVTRGGQMLERRDWYPRSYRG